MISTQGFYLPADLDSNALTFYTRDSSKPVVFYPFGLITNFKDEYSVLEIVSNNCPSWYAPEDTKVYVVFDITKLNEGGYIAKLSKNPVSTSIFDKQVNLDFYLQLIKRQKSA